MVHWTTVQIKSNHFYCHITTAQVPWWVKFLWACSDSAKNNRQFTYGTDVQKTTDIYYGQTVQKTTDIYIWTDSAKNNRQFTYGQTVQKNNRQFTYGTDSAKTALEHLQCSRQCKKNNNSNLHMDRQCKKATAIYIWTDSAKNNSNLHMDSTYLQTVQKTMCKIHIHILSTHSVL